MAMTLAQYKDSIIVGLGGFIVAWLVFLTWTFIEAPTRQDVQDMVDFGLAKSPYVADKPLISDKLQQLFANDGEIEGQYSRILEIVQHNKIELEKLILKEQLQLDEIKKMRVDLPSAVRKSYEYLMNSP